MLNLQGMTRAPALSWEVTMSPTGHCRKARAKGPTVLTIKAFDKPEAIRLAREEATKGGFSGFAITDIKEASP